jgi:hypothetical protein
MLIGRVVNAWKMGGKYWMLPVKLDNSGMLY